MDEQNLPQWLNNLLIVFSAIGGSGLLSWWVKNHSEKKDKQEERNNEVEDINRELSNKVLLDMIASLKSDITEQKAIEQVLRDSLMREMQDKVKFQTRLEMLLEHMEKNDTEDGIDKTDIPGP